MNPTNATPIDPNEMLPDERDQDERLFLHQIRKELDLDTPQETVKRVAAVLHALRQALTLEQANELLNQLPDFLKLAFAANWEQNEPQGEINHLDELVGLVMERDVRFGKGLFKNEVQTLTVIVLTLKNLQKLVDIENFDGLSPSLRHELRELPSFEAA
jgi:uncharacterized protein (DUF2267 family)